MSSFAHTSDHAADHTASRDTWPLVGIGAGITGIIATLITDLHITDTPDGQAASMAVIDQISQRTAHLSVVSGYITVALLLVLAGMWRGSIEPKLPGSNAARVVTHSLTAAAGALMLGYGWKGASAVYHDEGMDAGFFDDMGLYVYYILNDFGSYIGWLGVTIAAGAIAWMSLRERSLPLWIGIVSCVPVLAVVAFTGSTGLPGFPGVVSPVWMVIAFAGMAFTDLAHASRSFLSASNRPRTTSSATSAGTSSSGQP